MSKKFYHTGMRKKTILAITAVVLFAFLLSACGGVVEKGLKPSEDWSKGFPVADEVGGALGIFTDDTGEVFYLTWPEHTIERTDLNFTQLDQTGSVVVHQSLEVLDGRQRTPRIAPAGEDRLHLFWIRRPPREDNWELWHALLDPEGNIIREPVRMTSDEADVSSYDLVAGADGTVYLVCDCDPVGGLLGVEIGPAGAPGIIVPLTPEGNSPSLGMDQAGMLHMAWFEETQIKYANFAPFPEAGVGGEIITTLPYGTGTTLLGPHIGLSEGWVYLFWSTLNRSGLEAGKARTEYIAFPKNNPEAASTPERILILPRKSSLIEITRAFYPCLG